MGVCVHSYPGRAAWRRTGSIRVSRQQRTGTSLTSESEAAGTRSMNVADEIGDEKPAIAHRAGVSQKRSCNRQHKGQNTTKQEHHSEQFVMHARVPAFREIRSRTKIKAIVSASAVYLPTQTSMLTLLLTSSTHPLHGDAFVDASLVTFWGMRNSEMDEQKRERRCETVVQRSRVVLKLASFETAFIRETSQPLYAPVCM
jgi:hypothetical protein